MPKEIITQNRVEQGSLDSKCHKSPLACTRRKKRFYQRAVSGVTAGKHRNEFIAFLTLTSSLESPADITHSWEKLKKRIRRGYGNFEYIWVRERTQSGLVHMHILFRGPYIPQDWISKNWEEIHKAKIVYVEAVWDTGKAIRYMMKYLSKEMEGRFGYSWKWIFKGAAQVWKWLCRALRYEMKEIIKIWEKLIIEIPPEGIRWGRIWELVGYG